MKDYLLIPDSDVLFINKHLAILIGDKDAIFLDRLEKMLTASEKAETQPKLRKGRRWFESSDENWIEGHFPFWSEDELRSVIERLQKNELILVEKLSSEQESQLSGYTINYDHLNACFDDPTTDEARLPRYHKRSPHRSP